MVLEIKRYKLKVIAPVIIAIVLLSISFFACQKNHYQHNFELNAEKSLLENGLRLICLERHNNPTLSGVLVIKTGSATSSEFAATGIAHFTEHMLFKGSLRYKGDLINQKFDSFGGYINAYTTFDYTVVHFSILSQYLNEALEVLADMVFNPEFLAQEIEREKEVVLNEILLNLDDPDKSLWRQLFSAAYCRSLYRYPIIGDKDLFMALRQEELREFYRQFYSPNNMILSVVGDVEAEKVQELVERHFGQFKRQKFREEAFAEEFPQISLRRVNIDFATPTAKIAFAYHSVDIFDKDLFALDALSVVCGNIAGSIFETELVEKRKLAYAVNTCNYTPKHDGLFVITVDCDAEKIEEVIRCVRELVKNLRTKGVSARQLAKAKNHVLTGYYKGFESNGDLAERIAVDYALVGDYDFSCEYVKSIKNLSPVQLKRAASLYLNDSNLTICVLSQEPNRQINQCSEVMAEEPLMKVLPGGLKVLLRQNKNTPLLNIRVTYLGGLKDENAPLWGISNLTANLLFCGTKNYTKSEIDGLFSDWGGSYVTYSGNNTFGFSIEVLGRYARHALNLTREVMLEPDFPPEQLDNRKRITKAAIERQSFDVFSLGYLTLKESLYKTAEHPFFHSKLGELESVDKLSRKDIGQYYRKHSNTERLIVSVFGDFELEQILPYLEGISLELAKRRNEISESPLPLASTPLPQERIVKYFPKNQSLAIIGYKSIGIKDDDRYALEVITSILSGSGARLYKDIRDQKGLSYNLGAFNTYGLDEGFYAVYVETTEENIEEVINSIENQIILLKEAEVLSEELERAKNEITGGFLRGLQANSSFSFSCSLDELYGFGYDFYKTYPQKIKKVSSQDIKTVAGRYFNEEESVVVVVLPSKSLK